MLTSTVMQIWRALLTHFDSPCRGACGREREHIFFALLPLGKLRKTWPCGPRGSNPAVPGSEGCSLPRPAELCTPKGSQKGLRMSHSNTGVRLKCLCHLLRSSVVWHRQDFQYRGLLLETCFFSISCRQRGLCSSECGGGEVFDTER